MQNLTETPILVQNDPWLRPYTAEITARQERFRRRLGEIEQFGSLLDFATLHYYLGVNYSEEKKGWFYREWAPEATAMYLTGDFNWWDRTSHPLHKNEKGFWEIFLDDAHYKNTFKHGSKYKVVVHSKIGEVDRLPAFVRRVVQDETTKDFAAQVWRPGKDFNWKGDKFEVSSIDQLIIYECHPGMAQEKEAVGSFKEFMDNVLPRIQAAGYNAIQMMAVQEHPYYGSFGYHVSNFFAPSSRFGTPEELKELVKKAHSMGIAVIMDLVHSHAVKNLLEGLSEFDGTDHLYFHSGERGYHTGWDSRLFNYGKWEVQQFLLSNIRYWLEEFHFDGFRFDGVTSMLYHHHGFTSFDTMDKYFNYDVDVDAITYLQLANKVIHDCKKGAISIAEDVSGMPGLCRPIEEGGIGFDYRLGMGIPDYWIKLLKEKRDEEWNIYDIWYTLNNRRFDEKTIAYAESHDQAMVGDKTIAFRLMDKEMYFHMQENDGNMVIERGLALHKMIRFITIAMGGDGYLNFMGNEFGHPEWIDFPREGNGWSYKYARRQWSLLDNPFLKYKFFAAFDKAMIELVKEYHLLTATPAKQLYMDEWNQTMVFQRGELIFVFNFHPTNSVFGYRFYVPQPGTYKIILTSDDRAFGGFGRIDTSVEHFTDENSMLSMYSTNRTVCVFHREGAPKVVKRTSSAESEEAPHEASPQTKRTRKASPKSQSEDVPQELPHDEQGKTEKKKTTRKKKE